MIQPQPKNNQRHLAFAATAAIMFGAAVLNPPVVGASSQPDRDRWVEASIEACERQNQVELDNSKTRKYVWYGIATVFDIFGGWVGAANASAYFLDTKYDITSFTPINCDSVAERKANQMTWKSPPPPSAPPPAQIPVQVRLPTESQPVQPSTQGGAVQVMQPAAPPPAAPPSRPSLFQVLKLDTPQSVSTMTEPERAYIREFKSAMVMRGQQLSKRSRKGKDRGELHRSLVSFMDKVFTGEASEKGFRLLEYRIDEDAKIDPIVKQESRRIFRKVTADFRPKPPVEPSVPTTQQPAAPLQIPAPPPTVEAMKALDVLKQPFPDRPSVPIQPAVNANAELG